MASITYSGDFGGKAGAYGNWQITMTGNPLPSNATVSSVTCNLTMSVDDPSEIGKWKIDVLSVSGGPSAATGTFSPSSTSNWKQTFSRSMSPTSSVSAFRAGTFTLTGSVYCTGEANSEMHECRIVVEYTTSSSGGDSGSGTYSKATASVPGSVTAGSSSSVTIFGTSGLTYTVKWAIGSYYNTTSRSSSTTVSYTIPISWCNAIPNATSGTVNVTVTTYNGSTNIGSNTYPMILNVPSSVVPTIGTLTASRYMGGISDTGVVDTVDTWDLYVQNFSGVTLGISNGAGAYGSTIKSYTFTAGSLSQTVSTSSASASSNFGQLINAGTVPCSVYATDSRGRKSASKTVNLTVYECSPPVITTALAYRTTDDGTITDDGLYITATLAGTYSPVNDNNSCILSFDFKNDTDETWTTGAPDMSNNLPSTVSIPPEMISSSDPIRIRFTMTDALGQVTERIVPLGMQDYTLFFKKGGLGMSIGTQTSKAVNVKALEISGEWATYHGTSTNHVGETNVVETWSSSSNPYGKFDLVIPTVVISSVEPNPVPGLIWLKPSV